MPMTGTYIAGIQDQGRAGERARIIALLEAKRDSLRSIGFRYMKENAGSTGRGYHTEADGVQTAINEIEGS